MTFHYSYSWLMIPPAALVARWSIAMLCGLCLFRVGPVAAMEPSHLGHLPALNPTWQIVVVSADTTAEEGLGTFALDISAGDQALTLAAVILDCACLRLRTPLPLTIPAGGSVTLQFEVALLLPGPKTIQALTNRGPLLARLDLAGNDAPRSGRIILEAAWSGVPPGGSLTLLAHNLRAGNPADCDCAPAGLGGAERLMALNTWVVQHAAAGAQDVPQRWLSGSLSEAPGSPGHQLLAAGWQRPPSGELVVSPRPQVRLQTSPQSLVIPSPEAGPQPPHARLLTPPLSDGAGIEALIRNADGKVMYSVTVPVDDSFASQDRPASQ